MPLYQTTNYAALGMGAQNSVAQTASSMRSGSKTEVKQEKNPIGSAVAGGLAGAQFAGTEVGGAMIGAGMNALGMGGAAGGAAAGAAAGSMAGPIGMGVGALLGLASMYF
jgi:hypothetical protein